VKRRKFLKGISAQALAAVSAVSPSRIGAGLAFAAGPPSGWLPDSTAKDWMARWEKFILKDSIQNRYCDTELAEELGWMVSPFLDGFYYGYLATHDSKWVERSVDWSDSCIRRSVTEPDGFLGWPKVSDVTAGFDYDSMLGEAMMLRPMVQMANEILKTPHLKTRWGGKAQSYLDLAERTFEKWDSRGAWHDSQPGGLWVVQYFGIDRATGRWTEGFARRNSEAISHPDNKENLIVLWLTTMFDVTNKPVYRERAEKWWRLMRSRMKTRDEGKYFVWNYWEPAGPWDYKPDGSVKHWVGVHPNGGYYGIDLQGIVAAFEHGWVFSREDIDRLIATNRDFMWNRQMSGAKFQRIDGGPADPRWANSPGVLWEALVPYDETLRKIFVANHRPDDWGGLRATPWIVSLAAKHPTGG
jgi:hypothetical protein